MWWLVKRIYFLIALIIGLLILIKSLDYLHPDFTNGFLIGKETYFYPYYRVAIYTHLFSAPIALFSGLYQFTKSQSKWHKSLGKIYVFSILLLAAPSALFMAFYALGGFWASINFSLLAVLWFLFTWKAYLSIRKGQLEKHKQFMIRSFILCNSAIFIRLLSFSNNHYFHFPLETAYIAISWLSWLPTLFVFEVYCFSKRD